MARSEQDRQRDIDIIIEERAAEIQEERMHHWLPAVPYIFPFAVFLLLGRLFCRMIGIEPRDAGTGIALFTISGGSIVLFIILKKNLWKKYENEIFPPLFFAALFLFILVAVTRAH